MNEKPQVNFTEVLSDAGVPTTEEAVRRQFDVIVKQSGLITNTSKMSPFWRLITTIVTTPVMWLVGALANTVMAGTYLATASGQMLRLLAWSVNISPKPDVAAEGVIRFTKDDPAAVVTVPAATIVQTERINGVIYQLATLTDVTIDSGQASALIAVQAAGSGSAYNLAPGYYRILPVAISGIDSVQNEEDWLIAPGADEESDDELRDRARNQFNLVSSYHTDAVYRNMIAGVAGLSTDRIFFLHDAPRGPGSANAYLLLDTGVTSQPFIDAVNHYITNEGHHGHGDDMRCFAMPETRHELAVTLYVANPDNISQEQQEALCAGVENLIRCAFRENSTFDVKKTWPWSRFSFSNLGCEIHDYFPLIDSLTFSLDDIISELDVPRLSSLRIGIEHD